jgi:hypothetical protein
VYVFLSSIYGAELMLTIKCQHFYFRSTTLHADIYTNDIPYPYQCGNPSVMGLSITEFHLLFYNFEIKGKVAQEDREHSFQILSAKLLGEAL